MGRQPPRLAHRVRFHLVRRDHDLLRDCAELVGRYVRSAAQVAAGATISCELNRNVTDFRPSSQWLATVNRLALVTRVLGGTVHDVNNLLQIVSGNAELLESNAKSDLVLKRARSIRTTSA